MSTLSGGSSFNLSDYVQTDSQQSSQLNTLGTRSTASAAAGSTAQLQATQTESARDDDTPVEPTVDPDGLMEVASRSRKRTADDHGEGSSY